MHQSSATALAMPQKYSDWFSSCFGFPVVLAWLGPENYRPVLGNLAPNAPIRNLVRKQQLDGDSNLKDKSSSASSWLSKFVNSMPGLPTVFSVDENGVQEDNATEEDEDYSITFADCSPYLIVSTTSLSNISARLPPGEKMDMEKFRPNIIISGAAEAFEEDYWAELLVSSGSTAQKEVSFQLTANCVRCVSVTVDYATGKFGTGEGGSVYKKMQSDRRVDKGHPYSPVFGRYGFLAKGMDDRVVRVGDEVEVTKRNTDRTVFKWPGFGVTPKTDLYAS